MELARMTNSPDSGPRSGKLRVILADAIRFWEPRRLVYNVALAGVVVAWIGATWPHFRGAFVLPSLWFLLVLAMLANVCYCAAYLADVPIQNSVFRVTWRRWRWSLWSLGMIFATAIANYWIADEIYPYVR